MKAGHVVEEEKAKYPQVAIIPFESDRGYMATLNGRGAKRLLLVKGAPERVLEMCSADMPDSKVSEKKIMDVAAGFAKEGLRVLASPPGKCART